MFHIGGDGRTPRRAGRVAAAQGHVKDGAALGGVDGVALEHGLRVMQNLAVFGQLQQGLHDCRRDPLTRGVGLNARGFKLQRRIAFAVLQQFAQMRHGHIRQQLQCLPSRALFRAGEVVHGVRGWVKFEAVNGAKPSGYQRARLLGQNGDACPVMLGQRVKWCEP